MTAGKKPSVKPGLMPIWAARFDGIVRKMSNTLIRTGRSGVLNRARDFSCCIVTADCELLTAAEGLPIHVLSGPDIMARWMKEYAPDLKPGDAFLNNSPYHGCSHPADHTILIPVFDDEGVHRYTVLVKAHQADIGNSVPTTYYAGAKDIYQEGALIFPSVQVQRDYEDIPDIIRMCEIRIRVPEQWRGDFAAMIGAARIGEAELRKFAAEVGWDALAQFAPEWFDYSDRVMRDCVRKLPAGVAERVSIHDPFPGTPEDGVHVRSKVTIDPANAKITVDLTDNIDCLPSGLNLSEACARTSAMLGVFNSIPGGIPKNAGSFRNVVVLLRKGCAVGVTEHPFSCSAATTNLADRVANCVQAAIADLGDGIGMAEYGAAIPASCPVISGVDPRSGERYVNQMFLAAIAGAARPAADCWLTSLHVGSGGVGYLDSVELSELYHPILVRRRQFIPDTEGAGTFCGAPTMEVEFGPVGATIDVAYVSDGNINGPQGVRGGLVGGRADQFIRMADGAIKALPQAGEATIHPGEAIVARCTGGGGYGPPTARSRDRVRRDVINGAISEKRARDVYGYDSGDL